MYEKMKKKDWKNTGIFVLFSGIIWGAISFMLPQLNTYPVEYLNVISTVYNIFGVFGLVLVFSGLYIVLKFRKAED